MQQNMIEFILILSNKNFFDYLMRWKLFIILLLKFIQNSSSKLIDASYPPVTVTSTKTYESTDPTWITSPFFRANNEAVINTYTGSGQQPSYTFIYSSALPGIPNLAYAVKGYRGNDFLGQEYWEVTRTGLTATSFSVRCEIFGVTNLWILNVAYIAIDPTFPHHLNAFDNVPLNYSSGSITNISQRSTSQVNYFVEVINYTAQAQGRTFTKFNDPIQYNNIVLYMTNLWIAGAFKSGSTYFPVKFHITPTVLNSTHYQWNATLETNVMITKLQFSQIIFNSYDVQKSKKYYIQFQYWINDMDGSFIAIPEEFVDNFIMGVTDFETIDGGCGFEYQWEWGEQDGIFGIDMLRSWTIRNTCGFSWSRSTIFYMQTWLCENPYVYFNLTSGLCQTQCGAFTVENTTELTCDDCANLNCYQCYPDNPENCLECATYMNYIKEGDDCVCLDRHYEAADYCHTCQTGMQHCLDCSYDDGQSGTLEFDQSLYTCLECDETVDFFLQAGKCVQCTMYKCHDCTNLTACQQCQSGYNLSALATCITCKVEGCLYCLITNENKCYTCNQTLGYYASGNICEWICGDGIIVAGYEVCDDNNTDNFDGCSSSCTVEDHWECQGTTSDCNFAQDITLTLVNTDVSLITCNLVNFTFQITPFSDTFDQPYVNWTDFLQAVNDTMMWQNASFNTYSNGQIQVVFTYSQTIQDTEIHFEGNASLLIQNSTVFDGINVKPVIQIIHSDSSKPAIFQCCQGFYMDNVTGICLQICGDAKLYELECDDGNNQGGDGCTSDCKIQQDYECINGTTETPSICSYNGTLAIEVKFAIKNPHSNQIKMTYTIQPIRPLLNFVDNNTNFMGIISYPSNPEVKVLTAFYDEETGQLTVEFDYSQSIQDEPLSIQIRIEDSQNGSSFPVISAAWIVEPTNHLAAEYYSDQTYETVEKLEMVSAGVGSSQTVLFFGSLLFRKYIGLEMSFIIQIGVLSLMMNQKNSPLQSPLMDMPFVFGYNKVYLSDPPQKQEKQAQTRLMEEDESVDSPYRNMGYRRYFGFVYNLMFMIHLAVITVGLLFLLIGACTKKSISRKIRTAGFQLIGEIGFGLILFSFPNIVLGISIEIEEDKIFDWAIVWSKLFLVFTLIFIVMHLLVTYFTAEESAEVSTYFRKHSRMGVRAPLVHAFRMMIIVSFLFLYAIYPNASAYIILSTQLFYLVFVIFGQPHKKMFDTVRCGITQFILLYILTMRFIQSAILGDVYKNFTNEFYTTVAIVEYALYGVVIVLSIASIVYHLCKKCSKPSSKKNVNPEKLAVLDQGSDHAEDAMGASHAKLDNNSPSKKDEKEKHHPLVFDMDDLEDNTGAANSGYENINLDYIPSKRRFKF